MINSQPDDDKALDQAIAKVGEKLPALRKMGAAKKQKIASDRLSADKTKRAFQDMCDDPLLNEKGDDICLCERTADGKCGCRKHRAG